MVRSTLTNCTTSPGPVAVVTTFQPALRVRSTPKPLFPHVTFPLRVASVAAYRRVRGSPSLLRVCSTSPSRSPAGVATTTSARSICTSFTLRVPLKLHRSISAKVCSGTGSFTFTVPSRPTLLPLSGWSSSLSHEYRCGVRSP